MLKQILHILKIRREERLAAVVAAILFVLLNAMNVFTHWSKLSVIPDNAWKWCVKVWHMSGFDPLTYGVVTKWGSCYETYRHPLLAYFMYPLTQLNQLLISLTGVNFACVIVALLLFFCSFYAFLFLYRIFTDIIKVKRVEALMQTLMFFSFAHVMVASFAPDHFGMSAFCIILTLYVAGKKLQRGSALNWWQTIVLFVLMAGVSLNNGLKVFMAALTTRGKRFFRPGFLLFAVILPSVILFGIADISNKVYRLPDYQARVIKQQQTKRRQIERIRQSVKDTMPQSDSLTVEAVVQKEVDRLEAKKKKRREMSAVYRHTGKPVSNAMFLKWTDVSTSRIDIAVESLFGEGIMLHEDYLLGDVLVNRPVIVRYVNWFNYIVEGVLVLCFVLGIWAGRRSRFFWTAFSFFLLDMLLHMGLGFGINEIAIMSAHYLYVIPIALAFLLLHVKPRQRRILTAVFSLITAYLIIWNIALIVEYLV